MNTPTKLPADHTEAEGAIVLTEDQQLLVDNPALEDLLFERAKLLRQAELFPAVTDPEDITGMQQAKALRLQLRDSRTAVDKAGKAAREGYIKKQKAIITMVKPLLAENKKWEATLLASEQFAIRMEEDRLRDEAGDHPGPSEDRSKALGFLHGLLEYLTTQFPELEDPAVKTGLTKFVDSTVSQIQKRRDWLEAL